MSLREDHEFARHTAWVHQAAKFDVCVGHSYLSLLTVGMILLGAFPLIPKCGASGAGLVFSTRDSRLKDGHEFVYLSSVQSTSADR